MIVRMTVGLGWALLAGLGGGWLVAAPWALGEQPAGAGWTAVTGAQVGTGAGLIVLALLGAALVIGQVMGTLREAWALGRPVAEPAAVPSPAPQGTPRPDEGREGGRGTDEEALIGLAQALAEELTREELTRREVEPATGRGRQER